MDTSTTEPTKIVQRTDHEGVLQINAHTGLIVTPNDERPDWADGLACALLNERNEFYVQRLGAAYTDELRNPEALHYEDLGWVAVDEAGDEVEIEADAEHRMQFIADLIGVDRETGEIKGTVLAETEIAMDRTRSPEELAAFEHSQEAGFQQATGTSGG